MSIVNNVLRIDWQGLRRKPTWCVLRQQSNEAPLPRLAPNIAEYLHIALRLAHRFSRGQVSAGTLW
jgi:hypothetical protein